MFSANDFCKLRAIEPKNGLGSFHVVFGWHALSSEGRATRFVTSVFDGVSIKTQNATHSDDGLFYHIYDVYDVEAGDSDVIVTIASDIAMRRVATVRE